MNRSQDAALGTGHLVALATGGVIGLGVMSMPGIGIGIIGTGVWIAALVGLGFSVIALVPQLLLNSSGECPGGPYQQLRDTVGRYVGGVGAYLLCFLVFDIAAYALSAAQLLPVPPLVARGVAILIIAVFVALHAWGARAASAVQVLLILLLAVVFGLYAGALIPHVQARYLTQDVIIGSPTVFVFACLYMTFMMNGVALVSNYAAAARAPRRTVPRAMLVSLLVVALAYVLLCVVDAGVLPIARVANQDISVSARIAVPGNVVRAFTVGGSALALLTTLNAAIGWMVYPLHAACQDGWLPRELSGLSPRTGTPVRLLAVILVAGVVPLIVGVSTTTVSSSVTILILVLQLALAAGAYRSLARDRMLPRVGCVAAIVVDVLVIAWLLYTMNTLLIAGNALLLVVAGVGARVRGKRLTSVSNA